MTTLAALLDVLSLEATGEGRFRAANFSEGPGGVVFGGQILAQVIVAAARTAPGKEVKSLHTVFARGAAPDAPLDLEVEPLHDGRAFGSATVTVRQGDRLCTRSLVLFSASEPDLIRHGQPMPEVSPPEATPASRPEPAWWEIRVVGGVDVSDPDAVGPPRLDVWTRFPDAPADPLTGQALVAYASDGFLIGTAMRPHPGIGQSLAHVSVSTSVITHTLTFHEPVVANEWLLLAHDSPFAGRGRSYGRALVYRADGQLVAGYVQENMIRSYAEGAAPAAGARSRY